MYLSAVAAVWRLAVVKPISAPLYRPPTNTKIRARTQGAVSVNNNRHLVCKPHVFVMIRHGRSKGKGAPLNEPPGKN